MSVTDQCPAGLVYTGLGRVQDSGRVGDRVVVHEGDHRASVVRPLGEAVDRGGAGEVDSTGTLAVIVDGAEHAIHDGAAEGREDPRCGEVRE